jgi:hypothetical protein
MPGQFAGVVRDAAFLGYRRGRIAAAADKRRDLDAGDALKRVEMLLSEGALSGDTDFINT